jgi:hypothetical protein
MTQFQTSNFTSPLRYRSTYSDLASALNFTAEPNVLLFGCSTGIEILNILTIKPHANIVATDIHTPSLNTAFETFRALDNIQFCASDWSELRSRGPFDVIIANSVFCDHPAAMTKSKFDAFIFSEFDSSLEKFAAMMCSRSILMMQNSSYLWKDTIVSDVLIPLNSEISGFVPKFDRNGELIIRSDIKSGFPIFHRRPDFDHKSAMDSLRGTLFGQNVPRIPRAQHHDHGLTFDITTLADVPAYVDDWPLLPYTYVTWRGESYLSDYSFMRSTDAS